MAVRAEVLRALLDQTVVPVLAPISLGPDGVYNVNADEAAGAVAAALGDAEVVFVTNVPGVLVGGMVAPQLTPAEIARLIADGTISGGMIPKVRAALTALDAGVRSARITNLAGWGRVRGQLSFVIWWRMMPPNIAFAWKRNAADHTGHRRPDL